MLSPNVVAYFGARTVVIGARIYLDHFPEVCMVSVCVFVVTPACRRDAKP